MSDTPTPRTDACGDWSSPEHAQRIQFEGCTCVVMAPEDYEALYKHAQQLERELADAKAEVNTWKSVAEARLENFHGYHDQCLAYQGQLTAHKAALEKCGNTLEEIVSTPFYQRTCRGGEMERLMNEAIKVLGGGK